VAFEQEVMQSGKDGFSVRTRLRERETTTAPTYYSISDSTTAVYTRDWNLVTSGFNDYAPPLAYYQFSLYAGKTWRQAGRVGNFGSGQETALVVTGTVVGWEEVEVPAGKFQTMRVELVIQTNDPGDATRAFETRETHWYAPVAQRPVKVQTRSITTGTETAETIELISFDLKP
jgi:hypothetical protein